MKILQWLKFSVAALAVLNLILPLQLALADGPRSQAVSTSMPKAVLFSQDIALGSGNRLVGQVVDAEGKPVVGEPVSVWAPGERTRQTTTDSDGRFAFVALHGGVYQLGVRGQVAVCRCWSNNTAPPAATNEVLFVADESVQRGQKPIGEALFGPVLVAAIIAAAIAIPIAVHNNRKDAS